MPSCIARSFATRWFKPVASGLEAGLLERWYGGRPPGLTLHGIARLYGALMRLRRWAYRFGLRTQHHLRVPVLVVGNRTAGGAGKTPLVMALVEALRARGWKPGVVSRGYGRRSTAGRLVQTNDDPSEVGDEPLLIHRATGAPVRVDRDRVAAAQWLVEQGCDLIIADDGLQHLRLGRRVEVEVQDGRGHGNGLVMPAGPLREPLPSRAAHYCVVHGRGARGNEVSMTLSLGELRAIGVGRASATRALSSFVGQSVHAVAGIGHPPRFFAALRAAGLDPVCWPFPDHHVFQRSDFDAMSGLPIVMTAKDAVKCQALGLNDAWEVALVATLPATFIDALDHQLRTLTDDASP